MSCERREQDNRLYKQHPVFIAEVLSPSTEAFDRGAKFAAYRQLDSLQHYERTADQGWLLHGFNQDSDRLPLRALDINPDLGAIYEDVLLDFGQ